MKEYIEVLLNTKLFDGLTATEIETMLSCLNASLSSFEKGEYIFSAGDKVNRLAVLVCGKLYIQKHDYWGNRNIFSTIEVGEMFGEAYADGNSGIILNDVISAEESTVVFFDIHRILSVCSSACRFHSLTVKNLFSAISEKNRKLMGKLQIISKHSTREKLVAYLSQEAKKHNKSTFEIPFNRQQLADFISVDRSAMSRELCKMRDEGMLIFDKNRFTLIDNKEDYNFN